MFAVWIAAIVSPGPDLVQIIRLGVRSRATGVWTALGIMTGNTLWITGSLLGLSALISTYPGILVILQLLGGAYLLWMGGNATRGGLAARRQAAVPVTREIGAGAERDTATTVLQAWWQGLTTNLANPKAVLFFGAVFAQFVRPDMGTGWALAIAVILIITGVAWFVGFALGVRLLAVNLVRNASVIDIVSGVVFIALALFMLCEGIMGVGEWLA
nr:LysE family translocator [Corynebacterium lemuris]